MKLTFILLTTLLITLSSCACRINGEFDCMVDPQDTVKAMNVQSD